MTDFVVFVGLTVDGEVDVETVDVAVEMKFIDGESDCLQGSSIELSMVLAVELLLSLSLVEWELSMELLLLLMFLMFLMLRVLLVKLFEYLTR